MEYKALILDLDGTTIPNSIQAFPTDQVIDATRKASSLVHVILATGRPLYKTEYILEALHIQSLCVLSNGVHIYDPKEKRIIKEHKLNQEIVPDIIRVAKRFNLEVGVYAGVRDTKHRNMEDTKNALGIYMPVISPSIISEVEKELKLIKGISINKMASWEHGYECIDITDSNATKFHGIYEVMSILGLKKNEMIGVGDSYNDYSLLMACGLKVAMGNAVQELKDIADYIAPSVENDGVVDVIEKYIFSS